MNKNTILIIALLALVLMMIAPVSAETIAGNLSSAPGWDSRNYWYAPIATTPCTFNHLFVNNIEYTESVVSFIHEDGVEGFVTTYTTSAEYAQTPVTITLGAREIGTGTIGYQRQYTGFPPTEIRGYQYILFDTWNVTGLSGNQLLNLTYNTYIVGLNTYPTNAFTGTLLGDAPTGAMTIGWIPNGQYTMRGNLTLNRDISFRNNYNATKPSGLGITGWINKNELGGSLKYGSRSYILDGTSNIVLTSESAVSTDNFYFNIPSPTIKISLFSSAGDWYNTSTLFTTTTPEITGSYNITFHVVTYQGVNVYNAKVVFASKPVVGKTIEEVAVTGYTNASGMVTFYNQTAGAAAIVQVTATGYKDYVSTFTFTSDMIKEIQLSPPSVDLYVNIRDSSTGHYMEDFQVGIQNTTSGIWRNSTQETGSLYFDSTGANYEYPLSLNETVILAASKAGYKPNWKSVTIPYDMYTTTLYLINLNATAPSAGNFTAVIAVSDRKTGTGIQGASVNIQELGRAGATTTAGAVTFQNIAAGSYTLSVLAPGYQSQISDLTGTDGDTVLKSIQLLPVGCSISEGGTLICDGSVVVPGMTPATNQTANEKAAGGVTAFLDNIVGIGTLILIGIVYWFGKKILFS